MSGLHWVASLGRWSRHPDWHRDGGGRRLIDAHQTEKRRIQLQSDQTTNDTQRRHNAYNDDNDNNNNDNTAHTRP